MRYPADTPGGRALVALDYVLESLRRFGTDRSLLAEVHFCIDQDPPSPQFRITDGGVAYWLCSHRPQPHAQPA